MSDSNKTGVGRKGNRRYRSQRKKDPVSDVLGGNDMELDSTPSSTNMIPNKPNGKPTIRLQSLSQKSDGNNKGNKKGPPSYRNKKQSNNHQSNHNGNHNNNNSNKPSRSHSNDFTFKNVSDKRSNYTSVGIQTLSPMKVYIDEIFNQGFNHNRRVINSITQPQSQLNSLEMVDEDAEISRIQWNTSYGKNNSSIDGNISTYEDRKLSNASTVVGEESFYRSRRSSSMCSNATIINTATATNSYNNGLEKLSTFNEGDAFLEDPFLLKEPITIEDLNCSDIIRLERDITRLKKAIDDNDDDDEWSLHNSELKDPSYVTIQDSSMNRFMDIWLDYPSCCYNSLFQE